MNREVRRSPVNKIVTMAIFIAVASVIQLVENQLFPTNLPLRPGFANGVVLLVIAIYGPGEAVIVALARSVLAALVAGRLLSVPFFLSLSGGVASALVMSLFYGRFRELSVVGVSLTGAIVHNAVQLGVIRLFLIQGHQVLSLAPWLWMVALVTGLSVGFAVRWILNIAVVKNLAGAGRNSPGPVKT